MQCTNIIFNPYEPVLYPLDNCSLYPLKFGVLLMIWHPIRIAWLVLVNWWRMSTHNETYVNSIIQSLEGTYNCNCNALYIILLKIFPFLGSIFCCSHAKSTCQPSNIFCFITYTHYVHMKLGHWKTPGTYLTRKYEAEMFERPWNSCWKEI